MPSESTHVRKMLRGPIALSGSFTFYMFTTPEEQRISDSSTYFCGSRRALYQRYRTMDCFRGPRKRPAPPLTTDLLVAALKALPYRVELSNTDGVIFSNRPPGIALPVASGKAVTTVQISDGVAMTWWAPGTDNDNNAMVPLENVSAIVWVAHLNSGGNSIADFRVNSLWRDFYGQRSEWETWRVALHPDDRPSALETWEASLRSGKTFYHEHRARNVATGEYVWLASRAHPVRDASGTVTAFVGTE